MHLDVSVVPVVHREERREVRADELAVGMVGVLVRVRLGLGLGLRLGLGLGLGLVLGLG